MGVRELTSGINNLGLLQCCLETEVAREVDFADGGLEDFEVPSFGHRAAGSNKGRPIDSVSALARSRPHHQRREPQANRRHYMLEVAKSAEHLPGGAGKNPVIRKIGSHVEGGRGLEQRHMDRGATWRCDEPQALM